MAGRVHFTGRVPHEDVPELIRSADVVVSVPSRTPSGMVAIEAMACGVPVVVSPTGGNRDAVTDGVTGLHVPPRTPGALAGRLRHLLTDSRLGPTLAAAAARHAREHHDWDRIAEATEAVYERATGSPDDEKVMAGDAS